MRRLTRSLRNLGMALLALLCVVTFAIWIINELGLMRSPQHVAGRWSYQIGHPAWPWKITVAIFHDEPAPNVGPRMDPGPAYNPAVLAWYHKAIPSPRYRKAWGFNFDDYPNLYINSTRSMLLRGHIYALGMPDWAAAALWLSFGIVWFRKRRLRNLVRQGFCRTCHYNLTANVSGICPECGTAVTEEQRLNLERKKS